VEVEAPLSRGEVVDTNTMGEFGLTLWFGERAAAGWGGDTYSSWWSDDGLACMAVNIATDSDADREELVDAANRWADQDAVNRSVDQHQIGGVDLVLIRGCA